MDKLYSDVNVVFLFLKHIYLHNNNNNIFY